jgi:peptidyl-prolyl cis-trans isomerase A (cyclophilin A)
MIREFPMSADQPAVVPVVIETALGDIHVDVLLAAAPITAANFLAHVDAGDYTDGVWHRTVTLDNQPDDAVRIEVIQGGIDPARRDRDIARIPLERTTVTGLRHRDGTLSMSRFAPDTAHSDIFICIGEQPELDFGGRRNPDGQGFAAFAQVTRGMDVVRAIQQSPAGVGPEPAISQAPHHRQNLTPPVPILRIRRA